MDIFNGDAIERLNKLLESVTPWEPLRNDHIRKNPKDESLQDNPYSNSTAYHSRSPSYSKPVSLQNSTCENAQGSAEFTVSNLEGSRSVVYNGFLLAYGGCCGNYFNASVYAYDCEALKASKLPSESMHIPRPRAYHSICEFNGKFIVCGGVLEDQGRSSTVELLWEFSIDYSRTNDPASIDERCSVSWRRCQCGGHQPPFLHHHSSAIYANRMFIVGGISTDTPNAIHQRLSPCTSEPAGAEVYSLHLETYVWHLVCTLSVSRTPAFWGHTTLCVSNFLISVGGIESRSGSFIDDIFIFDVISLKWIRAQSIVTNAGNDLMHRAHHSASLYHNKGRAFIILHGGLSNSNRGECGNIPMVACEVPSMNCASVLFEWNKMDVIAPTARTLVGHISYVKDDQMYILGGYRYSLLESMNYSNIVFIFNLNTLKWNSRCFNSISVSSPTAADYTRTGRAQLSPTRKDIAWRPMTEFHKGASKSEVTSSLETSESEAECVERVLKSFTGKGKPKPVSEERDSSRNPFTSILNPSDATLLLESLPYYERELAGGVDLNTSVVSSPGKSLFLQYLNSNDKYYAPNVTPSTHSLQTTLERGAHHVRPHSQPPARQSRGRGQEPYHVGREPGRATSKSRPPRPQWGKPNTRPVELGSPFWTVKNTPNRKRSNSASSNTSQTSTASIINKLRRPSIAKGQGDGLIVSPPRQGAPPAEYATPVSNRSSKAGTPEREFNLSSPISESGPSGQDYFNPIVDNGPRKSSTPPFKQPIPIIAYQLSQFQNRVQPRSSSELAVARSESGASTPTFVKSKGPIATIAYGDRNVNHSLPDHLKLGSSPVEGISVGCNTSRSLHEVSVQVELHAVPLNPPQGRRIYNPFQYATAQECSSRSTIVPMHFDRAHGIGARSSGNAFSPVKR